MESPRYLRCLGPPALFTPAGEPVRFRTKKHIALLVYLGVEVRRFHRRDHLAELLWPGARTAEARHSLATALSVLRPRLGSDALQTSREQVSLVPGHLRLDLDRLLGGDVLGSEVVSPIEVANFLDGFDIPDAGEFGLWKDRQRARLLPAIKDALVLLIDRCRRTGDTRQIEQLADRMLTLDELSEEAIRAKMESRAFAGDRVGALKIFEEWKGRLAEELGAVPSDLLEGMAMRLRRRGWERTPIAEIPSAPADQAKGRPFIGRMSEHRVLYEAWEGLRKGLPAHALVLGDSGVGKSTLVMRLTAAAALEGAIISRVQSYDLERDIPYSTIGGLVQGLLDRSGVSATPPEALAEVARTVPEVGRRFPGLPEPVDSQGESARIRLTEAFLQMLTTIIEEHPVILVVDDLHLADEASLAVLHLVMRRARGQMIMVVLITRLGELGGSPQAARLRESGQSLGIREIELAPLTLGESADLLAALVPREQPQPSPSTKRALLRAAGGFPMVLELLTQDWLANGDQSIALAVDAMTADLESGTGPAAAYRHIIARIVRSLDHQTHNVLNLAAVLGHRLNDLPMYGLIDLSLGQTMAGLSVLAALRVLRDGSNGLEFVNELVRAAAYTSLPSPVRRALHSAVADRLLGSMRQREAVSGLELAWHCIRAGRESEATPFLLKGARDAVRKGAPDAAEHALSSAMPKLSGSEATEARLLLVEVLQEQGRWRESLDMLATLDKGSLGLDAQDALAYDTLARIHLSSSTDRDIAEKLPLLIQVIREPGKPSAKARASRVAAYFIRDSRDHQLSEQLLEVVDTITEDELDPDGIGQLALARGLLLYGSGKTSASLNVVHSALERLGKLGMANLVMAQLEAGLGNIYCTLGDYETALTCHEKAFRMASRLGNDVLMRGVGGNLVLCCNRLGKYDDQAAWLKQLPPAKSADFSVIVEMQLAFLTALGHLHAGRVDLADEAVATLDRKLGIGTPRWAAQSWAFRKADLLWLTGRRAEALRIAGEELNTSSRTLLSLGLAGPFARWIALTSRGCLHVNESRSILEPLTTTLGQYDTVDQAEILLSLCIIEERKLDWNAASRDKPLKETLLKLPHTVRSQLALLADMPRLAV